MKSLIAGMKLIPVLLIASSCSITNRNTNEEKVSAFLTQFEERLSGSDAVILAQFRTKKSDEMILKAIRIMQNVNTDSVVSQLNLLEANIVFHDVDIKVEVPAQLRSTSGELIKDARFTLWLTVYNGDLYISEIAADEFYSQYSSLAFEMRYRRQREREMANRQLFFDQAMELEKTYDTVVWYSQYQDSIYYYVVNGNWRSHLDENFTFPDEMGLVSETGRVIVPPKFSLVGTIGFSENGLVEVKKGDQVGYYSLTGEELIPPHYDWVVFYEDDSTTAIVKQGANFGWLDKSYVHHTGFRNAIQEIHIKEFNYLNTPLTIKDKVTTMTEVLDNNYIGFGIVMPPAYLVSAGIFGEIISNVNIGGPDEEYYGTDFIETRGSFFERLTDNLSVLFVSIHGRYIGGREEFYSRSEMTFVDNNAKVIANSDVYSANHTFTRIDSTLLQLNVTPTAEEAMEYWGMEETQEEWNTPHYQFFRIMKEQNSILELKSKRRHALTEFVKLDSSYIQGQFVYWDFEKNDKVIRDFVSNSTLEEMRNEILATYGYSFKDENVRKTFEYNDWYKPEHSNYEAFLSLMTDIDRHNLEFLERIVGTLQDNSIT